MKPENHEQEIKAALQKVFSSLDTELRRDLWPAMLQRLDAAPEHVPWYDWALALGLGGAMVLFPKLLLLFAYHL